MGTGHWSFYAANRPKNAFWLPIEKNFMHLCCYILFHQTLKARAFCMQLNDTIDPHQKALQITLLKSQYKRKLLKSSLNAWLLISKQSLSKRSFFAARLAFNIRDWEKAKWASEHCNRWHVRPYSIYNMHSTRRASCLEQRLDNWISESIFLSASEWMSTSTYILSVY